LKKKSLVIFLILIPILAAAVIYLIKTQDTPVFKEQTGDIAESDGSGEESVPEVMVTPTPIPLATIKELLTELETGIQAVEEERIIPLVNDESALGYYSNLVLANRYERAGKDASTYYRTALSLYYTKDVHFRFASHLFSAGKTDEAENEYLELLPDEEALQALTELNTKPERIGEAYINKKEWKAAEEVLKPVVENNSGDAPDIMIIKYYAQALVEQNALKRALPFYKQLYELEPENSGVAWWYARCLESAGQVTSAVNVYSSIGERGAYRRGIILQNSGKTMEAADVFSTSNEAVSLWQAARIWDIAGMWEEAVKTYARVADTASAYQDDAAYRAYILSKRFGNYDTDKLLEVLSNYPAWMVRIGKEPVYPEVDNVDYDRPEYIKRAAQYEREGYTDAAAIEVAIGSKQTNLEEKLALGDWFIEKGEYYNSILWGIRSLNEKPTRRGYELAYPRGFEELVHEVSEKYELEPELIWAVIREESHFRPDAVSSAGALGLMQIMPPTGKDIAARLGLSITEDDLLNPEISVRFGSFYVRSMLNMFEGDIDKALAAYNGGAGNVKKWMTSSIGTLDEDFPTAIAFRETQEYITKVRNSYYIYKWLYE